MNSSFTGTSDVIRSMAFKMLEKFDCYWNMIHGVMAVATILDNGGAMCSLGCS